MRNVLIEYLEPDSGPCPSFGNRDTCHFPLRISTGKGFRIRSHPHYHLSIIVYARFKWPPFCGKGLASIKRKFNDDCSLNVQQS